MKRTKREREREINMRLKKEKEYSVKKARLSDRRKRLRGLNWVIKKRTTQNSLIQNSKKRQG